MNKNTNDKDEEPAEENIETKNAKKEGQGKDDPGPITSRGVSWAQL